MRLRQIPALMTSSRYEEVARVRVSVPPWSCEAQRLTDRENRQLDPGLEHTGLRTEDSTTLYTEDTGLARTSTD